VITSVQYQVQVWRLRSRMRYRGACETLAHVLEALDYSAGIRDRC
jgi:transglutaminase-like putative cysteine protease